LISRVPTGGRVDHLGASLRVWVGLLGRMIREYLTGGRVDHWRPDWGPR
jgi:hypothetical protein